MWRFSDCQFKRACLCAAVLALLPVTSWGQELSLTLQPSVSVAGARWQRWQLPSATSLKALLGIAPAFDISFGVGLVGLPSLSESNSSMSGMASMVGAGLRWKRPHDQRAVWGASPWIELEALSVQGGSGDRRALAVGGGVALPLDAARRFWVGPFVRYLQLVQEDGGAGDRRASDGLFGGFTFEIVLSPPRSSERGRPW